jgi:exosortase
MAETALPAPGRAAAPIDLQKTLRASWPLILGLAALAVPSVLSLSKNAWARESGAHGPLVLVTGLWLLFRQMSDERSSARQGKTWISAIVLLPSLAVYVISRVFDFASLEVLSLIGIGVAFLHDVFGVAVLRRNWFPLFFLLFAVPPPGSLVDQITAPLKQFVSEAAMKTVYLFGVPASREGVTIYVSKYQLLMEDACSGMNSLFGLTAVSLLYIYLLRGAFARYCLLMTLFVIPIAIVGNILRVIVLILLTYFMGDGVAQGFLHYTTGFLLFILDLILVFAVDSVLFRLAPKSWKTAR